MTERKLCVKSLGYGVYTVEPADGDTKRLTGEDFANAASSVGSRLQSWTIVEGLGFMACEVGHKPTQFETCHYNDVCTSIYTAAEQDWIIAARLLLIRNAGTTQ